MAADRSVKRTVGGQAFKVTTPGRVLYPATGTTKTQVIDYYLAVAEVMLPHLAGRDAVHTVPAPFSCWSAPSSSAPPAAHR